MYHRIVILALLFLIPEESNSSIFLRSPMEISDALPVQFWLTGCETYNEHETPGVHQVCFCQPWECDDEIKLQFKDTASQNFSLLVLNEDEQILQELSIEEISSGVYEIIYTPSGGSPGVCDENIQLRIRKEAGTQGVALPALNTWTNGGGAGDPWTTGSSPSITVNEGDTDTEFLFVDFPFIVGVEYTLAVNYTGSAVALSAQIEVLITDGSFNQQFSNGVDIVLDGANSTTPIIFIGTSSTTRVCVRIAQIQPITPFDLSTFLDNASGDPWTIGIPAPFILNSHDSSVLYTSFPSTTGTPYHFHYRFEVNNVAPGDKSVAIALLDIGGGIPGGFDLIPVINNGIYEGDVILTPSVDGIDFGVNNAASLAPFDLTMLELAFVEGLSATVTINSTEATRLLGEDEIIAKSDCLDIRQEHKESILLTYSNHRNFAGLVYEDISPENQFQIRVPSVFYHERYPEEDEVIELSSSLATLNGTVKKQRRLDTDYMPYYMHEKMKLILKHQSLEIYNRAWIKQEAYEILEGDKRWPVKMARVWLSERDFVHRNIL